MAKEWDKFQTDYEKLKPSITKYAFSEASAYSKRMGTAHANCSQGEQYLAESMVSARKNGVTGSGLSDFVKDNGFKEALGLLDKATSMLTEATRAFESFCLEAGTAAEAVGKLHAAIEKDLKGRKDSSATKQDIQALSEQTVLDQKDLLKCSKYYGEKVNPAILNYAKNYQKTVAAIMKQAPEVQEKAKEATELPQLFVDRNIKKNFAHAVGSAQKISALCDSAMHKAQADLAAATPDLRAALDLLKELKAQNEEYVKAVAKFGDAINDSKDKDKTEKMIEGIAKAYETAERKLRGTMATIKKAG